MRGKKSSVGLAALLAIVTATLVASCSPAAAQTETVLFSFGAPPLPSSGGTNPSGKLVFDSKDNLYGTTTYGGHSDNCNGGDGQASCGVAFQLTPKPSGSWMEKVLHTFNNNGTDGTYPGGMIFDAAGNLYGTTSAGGTYGEGIWYFGGTAFELSPAAAGKWTEKILYDFGGNEGVAVGFTPGSPLIFDSSGNLYGTTFYGGGDSGVHGLGCGSVFELTPGAGGTWTASSLHTFTDLDDGCGGGSLILSAAGNLFGAADFGKWGYGVVFELTPSSGGTWTDVILESFNNDAPKNTMSLVLDAHGNVYGANCGGSGIYKYGAIFELTPVAGGKWTYSIPYTFTSTADGTCPTGLVFDAAGNLYGVTVGGGTYSDGTVFELTPSAGGWTETVLHSFAGGSDGSSPTSLTLAATGDLYGTTFYGGAYNGGTVFKIVP